MAINAGKNVVSGALNGKFNASCFAAGTMIETADGDRPIEEIQIGDLVLSANPETGEIAYKPVVNTYVHVTDTVLYLTIDEEIIETTEDHPFWVEGQGWTSAKLLQPGDVVWLKDGSTQCVDDIEIVELPEGEYVAVYNFEVADFHTYFVSDYDVLVHNDCKDDAIKEIDPRKINYSQRTINLSFDTPNGKRPIQKIISKGSEQVGNFKPINVINVKGQYVVRDGNSRLYIAQKTKAKKIKVHIETDIDAFRDLNKRLKSNGLPKTGTKKYPKEK